MIIKNVERKINEKNDLIPIINGMGKRIVISTSKMRKITAIRKNCIENGVREKYNGLNPHSNDDGFSRSLKDLDEIREFNQIMANEIISAKQKRITITFFLKKNFKVGSFMYLLY